MRTRAAGSAGPGLSRTRIPPFARSDFDDSGWRVVRVPHDWAIEGPFLTRGPYGGMGRLKSWGPVWYRESLKIPASTRGRSLFLDVDGAMAYATVWLNGRLVGGWPYGYASWRLNLTPYLVPGGRNQLAIRLDSLRESSRWYPGAGLYRNVWLIQTSSVHVGQWGGDPATVQADGKDLSFVTLQVTDAKGVVVPRAAAPIEFSVEGPGEIVATDNGDATDFESFQSPRRRAFNGLCLAVIRRIAGRPGTIVLCAKSPGLEAASIELKSAGSGSRARPQARASRRIRA